MAGGALRAAWLGLPLLALAACATPPADAPPPVKAPIALPPVAKPVPPAPTQAQLRKARALRNQDINAQASQPAAAESQSQASYYAKAQAQLLAQGRLRRDRVPQDAPIDADSLTRDFLHIALRDEYSRDGARMIADGHPAPLRRWTQPVRFRVEFGPSASVARQRAERAEIASVAARLSQASGHAVTLSGASGNFLVMVLTEDERRVIGPRLATLVPGIPDSDIAAIRDLSPRNYCTVFAYSRGDSPGYAQAVALIRAELPPLLRSSCYHEELAQGLGLANDSPEARPSIFNDDEEFALLTRHDELLLQILYDPRLRPGMSEAEAAPIVRRIAAELVGATT